jgi:uncharacterized C2H2 Zn-finger protein
MGDGEVGKGKENIVKFVYNDTKGDAVSAAAPEQPPHPCYICNKTFNQRSGLTKHLRTHKMGEGNKCQKCDKIFAAPRDLRKHVDIVHLNKAEEYKKECPICHVRVQQLKTHIRFIHRNEGKTSEFSGICPHCEKSFSNDYKVKRHIETVHEGVKHWQCSVCPKKFYEKKDLGRHIRGVHMGEKVDTWRARRLGPGPEVAGLVVVTRNALPTAQLKDPMPRDVLNAHTTLPVNVMAEEGEEQLEGDGVDDDDEEEGGEDEAATPSAEAVTCSDPADIASLRFQVRDRRVEENGDIVVEIEEKEDAAVQEVKPPAACPMVTLKWGSPSKQAAAKVTDLEMEGLGEDFVLPEVVGDLPDWLLQGGGELDILKVQEEGGGQRKARLSESLPAEEKAKTAFKCGACGKMFLTLDFLKTHIEKTHITGTYKLPEELSQLDSTAANKTVFKVHNDEHGKKFVVSTEPEPGGDELDSPVEVEGEDRLRCDVEDCGKTFSGKGRKLQYKRHVERIHLSIRNKQCPQCKLSFYEKRDLTRHVEAIHHRIRTVCPIEGCARPVVRLDQHIKMVHTERRERVEKGSRCNECGASFSRVYDMTRHRENVHKGLKGFQCDKCDRKFTDKRDLKRHHDAVHLNIRQSKVYLCNFCDKNFKFKKLLDSHRQEKHGDRSVADSPGKQLAGSPSAAGQEELAEELGPLVVVGEDQEEVALGEELNTVEIEGQLFLVQQNSEGGLALLPVVHTEVDGKA